MASGRSAKELLEDFWGHLETCLYCLLADHNLPHGCQLEPELLDHDRSSGCPRSCTVLMLAMPGFAASFQGTAAKLACAACLSMLGPHTLQDLQVLPNC